MTSGTPSIPPSASTSTNPARGRPASPLRFLSPEGKRAVFVLGFLATLKALALVMIAEAVASGIVGVIASTGDWRRQVAIGLCGGVLRAGASWATDVVAARAATDAKADIRRRLAARMVIRGGRDLDERVGATTTLATTGLDALDTWYRTFLPAMVSAMTIPLLIGARILWADWVSAVIVVLTVPLIPVFMILIGSYTQDRVGEAADALARLSNQLVELARGLPVLVGLGRADAQVSSLRDVSEGYRTRTMETLRVAFLSSLALELIATISVAVVAVFIGVRLVHGDMSLEIGLLALLLAPECYLPFREVGAAFHAAEDGIEAMERSERIAAHPKASVLIADRDERTSRTHPALTTIAVSDLRVRYADRVHPAVDGLSFSVAPGEVIALAGPSGCGKSTALAAIAGLLGTTDDGAVQVSGKVDGVAANGIAWVPQHPVAFAETVGAEIQLYGHREDASRDEVLALLGQVGADHLIDRHPAELSPGELRRVALARALARIDAGATLLLLDEPTAHLDAATSRLVLDLIADLRGRVTILLVAHDAQVRALADRIVAVGAGPTRESLSAEGVDTASDLGARSGTGRIAGPALTDDIETRGTVRDLLRIVQPWRGGFLLAIAWGTVAALMAVALTSVSGWLIVRASQHPPILYLLMAIVGVRFFGIGRSIFRYLERLRMHDVIFGAMTELRIATWLRLAAQGPSIARFLRGERAIDHLIGDIDRVRDLTPRVVMPPLVGASTALAVTIALGILLPATVPVMLACAVVCLVLAPMVSLRADEAAGEGDVRLRSRTMRMLAGLFAAAPDLRANDVDGRVLAELDHLERQATAASRRTAWALGMGQALVIVACTATAMAMFWLAHGALADGAITPQIAAVLILTPLALVDPFIATCDAVQQWPALRIVLGRFRSQMDGTLPTVEQPGPAAVNDAALGRVSSLSVEDLAARWPGMTQDVFSGLTATTSPGRWLAVTGPSGSGKSTFLTVLQTFLRPSAGRYLLNARDTAAMRPETMRRHIAWCPQEAHLFDSSLRANLVLARSREDAPGEAELEAALRQVGLGDLLADLPDGLETAIGSQGSHLSGGQRQRVAIARTLLTRAEILLIDEPTAHLDRESADALMADLRTGLSDRVVVLVTHHAADLALTDSHLRLM
ncbi:MAG: thiol reductant ABC exporter subunit CydD [Thermomicrobiales bacterium]